MDISNAFTGGLSADALSRVGCNARISPRDLDDISTFVVSIAAGEEPSYLTPKDAAICILEWVAEGLDLPHGLTPIRLSVEWNSFMYERF